jgi:hypothetical protein
MKTLKSILLIVSGICLFIACSKDEPALPVDELQNDGLACGKVFKVQPTKGTDITTALKQAFDDAIEAGPGNIVQLPEGEFDLGFIEIHEFFGSFIGSGKGKTIITVKTGLDCGALINQNLYAWLISFVGGNINMSDMTLKYPQGTLVCEVGQWLTGFVMFTDYNAIYTSSNHYIKATINNVDFIGDPLVWNAVAAGNGTELSGRSHLDMKITNCTFDTFSWGAQMIGIKEGKLILGTMGNGNTFTNCNRSVVFQNNINVNFEVVRNKFNVPVYALGLWINNSPYFYGYEPQTKSPLITVEGNTFNLVGANCGIRMHDGRLISNPEENLPVLFQVNRNQFNMSNDLLTGTTAWSGIIVNQVKSPVFRNNIFSGIGDNGMVVAPTGDAVVSAEDGLIIGNNFSNTTFTMAAIMLSEWTKNWTVAGVGKKNIVIDKGINNIITGMKVKTSLVHADQNIFNRLGHMQEDL